MNPRRALLAVPLLGLLALLLVPVAMAMQVEVPPRSVAAPAPTTTVPSPTFPTVRCPAGQRMLAKGVCVSDVTPPTHLPYTGVHASSLLAAGLALALLGLVLVFIGRCRSPRTPSSS
jgi:LPXTG-motif cell wall-anchored protein